MTEPSDLIITVVFSCYILYAAAILFGLPCNFFVLYRMRQLNKKCADLYRFVHFVLRAETSKSERYMNNSQYYIYEHSMLHYHDGGELYAKGWNSIFGSEGG